MELADYLMAAGVLVFCGFMGRYAGGSRDVFPEHPVLHELEMGLVGGFHYFLFCFFSGLEFGFWHYVSSFLLMGILYTLGERPGVGQPKGTAMMQYTNQAYSHDPDDVEQWQWPGILPHPFESLYIRGFIWILPWTVPIFGRALPKKRNEWIFVGLSLLVSGLFIWLNPLLAFVLAMIWALTMPSSMWVGLRMPIIKRLGLNQGWDWSEFLQPIISGVLIILFAIGL